MVCFSPFLSLLQAKSLAHGTLNCCTPHPHRLQSLTPVGVCCLPNAAPVSPQIQSFYLLYHTRPLVYSTITIWDHKAFIFTAFLSHIITPGNLVYSTVPSNTGFTSTWPRFLFHNSRRLFLHQNRSSETRLVRSGTTWVMGEIVKPEGLASCTGRMAASICTILPWLCGWHVVWNKPCPSKLKCLQLFFLILFTNLGGVTNTVCDAYG